MNKDKNNQKYYIGLNISDFSLEAVVLSKSDGRIKVIARKRILFDAGVVVSGRAINQPILAKLLKSLFDKIPEFNPCIDEIVFGLPEALVYLSVIYSNDKDEIHNKVKEEVENNIPIDPEKIDVSTKVFFNKKENLYRVVIAAIKKKDNIEWQQFFKTLKYNVCYFDVEALANFRGLLSEYPSRPIVIMDIGAMSANLSFYNHNGLAYSYSIPYAGDYFTDKLAKALKISWEEAEELKQEYGLNQTKNKEAGIVLRSAMGHYAIEIERNINFFQNEIYTSEKVDRIHLIGGTGLMRGLKEFLEQRLRIEVIDYIKDEKDLFYKNAYGLALKAIHEKWQHRDPDFKISKKQSGFTILKSNTFKEKNIHRIKFVGAFVLALLAVLIGFQTFLNFRANSNTSTSAVSSKPDIGTSAPAVEVAATTTEKEKEYAKIKEFGSNLNLRQGPGTEYEIVGTGEANEEFLILKQAESWVKIQYNSDEAWAYKQFLDIIIK